MKNFNKVNFTKGTVCYLSAVGMYGYWYASTDYETVILEDVEAEHLSSWKNQGPYYAFKMPARYVKTINSDLEDHQLVCVWFKEKQILENMMQLEKDKKDGAQ